MNQYKEISLSELLYPTNKLNIISMHQIKSLYKKLCKDNFDATIETKSELTINSIKYRITIIEILDDDFYHVSLWKWLDSDTLTDSNYKKWSKHFICDQYDGLKNCLNDQLGII